MNSAWKPKANQSVSAVKNKHNPINTSPRPWLVTTPLFLSRVYLLLGLTLLSRLRVLSMVVDFDILPPSVALPSSPSSPSPHSRHICLYSSAQSARVYPCTFFANVFRFNFQSRHSVLDSANSKITRSRLAHGWSNWMLAAAICRNNLRDVVWFFDHNPENCCRFWGSIVLWET